jgi:hypothetical protein
MEQLASAFPSVASPPPINEARPSAPDTRNVPAPVEPSQKIAASRKVTDAHRQTQFDIVAYCKTISEAVGGSHQIESSCREQEQAAKAAFIGRDLPSSVETYCRKIAQAIGGSYQIMNGCIDQEIEAKSKL